MSVHKLPTGWDADRVKRLIDQHESQSDDELAAEDDAASEEHAGQAVVTVPVELLPAIRRLLADHKAASV